MQKKLTVLIGVILTLFMVISIFSMLVVRALTHPIPAQDHVGKNVTKEEFFDILKSGSIKTPLNTGKIKPSNYGIEYKKVSFLSRDGIDLVGWYMPTENAKGTIIIAHGWGSSKENMLKYAVFLNQNGYATFVFDFRGFGESSGNYTSLGYYERYDILGALEYLQNEEHVDPKTIGGLGLSMGCAALIFAANEDRSFRSLALDSCYTSINENLAQKLKTMRIPSFPLATVITIFSGLLHGFNGFELAPVKYIKSVDAPVLIIQGSQDDLVPPPDATLLYESAKEPKELWIVEGGKHVGNYKHAGKIYEEKIVGFFDETLA